MPAATGDGRAKCNRQRREHPRETSPGAFLREPGEIDELDELHTNRIPLLLRYGADYAFNRDRVCRASFIAAIKYGTVTPKESTNAREGRR